MNKIVTKTNGKKTTTVGALSVLFEALMLIKPGLLGSNEAAAFRLVINSGLFATISHKVWRNRKNIYNSIKNVFKKKDGQD